jgi:hypothetical protein
VTDTVKTVLLVGGTAVGAFLLIKAFAPGSPASPGARAPRNTDVISLGGLSSLASAFGGLFGGGSSSSSPTAAPQLIDSAGGFLGTRQEWKDVADYDAQGTAANPVYGIAGIDF